MAASALLASDIGCSVGLALAKTVRGHEVRSFLKYGPAELSKQILVGDMLFNINDKPTAPMSAESVATVRNCSSQRVRHHLTLPARSY
jgi:C-terminal processing protease CtpA/Prc